MRCLKLLYTRYKITELIITAAFTLLVIVLMEGLLPLSQTMLYCDSTRKAFRRTDNILYFTSNAPEELLFGKTEVIGIDQAELPFEKDGSVFTTSRYEIYTDYKLSPDTAATDLNGKLQKTCINVISYSTFDWNALDPKYCELLKKFDESSGVGLLITKDLVDKYGYSVGDRFDASVKFEKTNDNITSDRSFFVAGILDDNDPILSVDQWLALSPGMSGFSVNRYKYNSDYSFAIAIDPNGLLPKDRKQFRAALISLPEGFDPQTVARQFNEKYTGMAILVPYKEIEEYTLRSSWDGNTFSLLLLITLGTVLMTSFTGFTVTRTDRMRQTIKNLYINGMSRRKILALFFAYYMTLIAPAFAIGLAVFAALPFGEFHGYNPLILMASGILLAAFLFAGTLVTILNLRKNLIITYDKA